MSLKILEHVKDLLAILDKLLNAENKHSIPVNIFDFKYGFLIHLIPENTCHPLKDIVNSVKQRFFLVSKLPNVQATNSVDDSDDDDEEKGALKPGSKLPELAVTTKQHVFVGTPISQQLHYLFWQKNFHDGEMVITEKYIETGGLLKLPISEVRYMASLYVQCVKQREDLPQMWLLCDHAPPQEVEYMGVVPSRTEDPKHPWQVSTVMVRSDEYNKKPGSTLNDLKKYHMTSYCANPTEVHGYARYNVYSITDGCGQNPDMPQSSISIEFAWDGVREMLQPPPSSSNAVFNIFADPEDVQSILPGITGELNTLGGLYATLQKKIHEQSLETVEKDEPEDDGFDQAALRKNTLAFLDKLRLQSMGQPVDSESVSASPSNPIAFGGLSESLNRQDLDNTESLWLFLKELSSSAQMMFCLDIVLHQALAGDYQPVLYTTNQTRMASLMREAISCTSEKERVEMKTKLDEILSPIACLESIVDIGIDKLQNDYVNYFIKQELVTKDLLEYFIAKDVSNSEKLQRLLKLHCILSLVTLSVSYARIDYDNLRQLIPAALKFYENHSHTEIPLFSLSLPAFSTSSADIKNTCVRQFQPQAWVAAITTSDHHLTMAQLHAKDPTESLVEGNATLQGNSYSITIVKAHKVCI